MSKNIGDPIVRRDGHAKVTGGARYTYEVDEPGTLYGVLVTSNIARGKVIDIATIDALRMPGVVKILTPFNAMKLPGPYALAPPDRVVQPLQDDRVVFSNQPVAVAIADTFERAMHAALTVGVRYQVEKHTVRLEDELPHAAKFDIVAGGRTQPADEAHGDIEQGLKSATTRVEQRYETPAHTHNPMEPHATLAKWDDDTHLTVHDSTQWVFGVQKKLAKAFALDPTNVHVVSKFVGGAFGSKGAPWSHVLIAALAAKQVGAPVKIALTRPQMFGMVGGRPRTMQTLALGASRDGKLTALRHESTSTTSQFDVFVEAAAMQARHLYAAENIESKHRLVRLDIGTPTFMRAPGEASGSFGLECALDELARSLKMDPIELRLKNYASEDPIEKRPFSSKALKACYAEGAKTFGWAHPRPKEKNGLLVGVGMATAAYPGNFSPAEASARIEADGRVFVESGMIEVGNGAYTVMAQVAADALGVPVESVTFDLGDTQLSQAPITAGSLSSASVGSAVLLTARKLRDRLLQMAVVDAKSPLFGADPKSIQVEGGVLKAKGKTDRYTDVLRRAGGGAVVEKGGAKPGPERQKFTMMGHGAQFAEVHVDPELGTIRVARMVGAFATGRVLNARTARSQLLGGMVWGIGMALLEHSVYDERLGRIQSRDFADYHVASHADIGELDAISIEEVDEHVDPLGAKGMGEIGICGAAAAIANAVFDATGKRIRKLPITLDALI